MLSGNLAFCRASKRGLKRKYEGDAKLVEHLNTRSCLFTLRHGKCAILKVEIVELFRKYQREQRRMDVHRWPLAGAQLVHAVAVLEDVLLHGVPVEVEVEEELLALHFLQCLAQFLRIVHRRMHCLAWLGPLPIEVARGKRASVITVYHAVDVQHRNNIELEMVFQIFHKDFLLVSRRIKQAVDQAVHHPGRASFPWMHSRGQHYDLLF